MGDFVLYLIEWAFCLLAFMVLYKLCFSGCTFHRFNRYFLLGSVLVSAVLPLIHISFDEEVMPVVENVQVSKTEFAKGMSSAEITITADKPMQEMSNDTLWAYIIIGLYLIYIILLIIGWTKSIWKMARFLRGKKMHRLGKWIRIVEHEGEFGPFSWMNFVVISREENGFARKASIRHELAHVTHFHYADLILLLACTILNPVCWLVMKELKIIHEYEADDEVINHPNIQSREYQRLLIKRTVGAEAYALASSFNINIKQRIIMMKKEKTTKWRIACIMIVLPLIGFALTAFATQKEAIVNIVNTKTEAITKDIEEHLFDETSMDKPIQKSEEAEVIVAENDSETDEETSKTITGTVKNENGEPLPNANILALGEYNRIVAHSVSDLNGKFELKVPDSSNTLQISFVGYQSVEKSCSDKDFNIVLKSDKRFEPVTIVVSEILEAKSEAKNNEDTKEKDDNYFEVVSQMPEYPGGQQAIAEYISNNIKYPSIAAENNVQAKFDVQFFINTKGKIRSPKVVNLVEAPMSDDIRKEVEDGNDDIINLRREALEALKAEAIHVVRNMGDWKPAMQNRQPVVFQYTIPFNFILKDSKNASAASNK